jgi:Hedgehog amino-terminal signalling domain
LAGPRARGDPFAAAMPSFFRALLLLSALGACGCDDFRDFDAEDRESLAKVDKSRLAVGQRIPNDAEANVVGLADAPVQRGSSRFKQLVDCEDCPFVFKNEERNESDRMMTPRLRRSLVQLSKLVSQTWPKLELRVTEAWDDRREHGAGSVHYEGRAADITTSDQDPAKLGQLAALAVRAGFDWVYYEDSTHVHVSVKR